MASCWRFCCSEVVFQNKSKRKCARDQTSFISLGLCFTILLLFTLFPLTVIFLSFLIICLFVPVFVILVIKIFFFCEVFLLLLSTLGFLFSHLRGALSCSLLTHSVGGVCLSLVEVNQAILA